MKTNTPPVVQLVLRVFGPGAVVVFDGPAPCAQCAERGQQRSELREEGRRERR